MCVMRRLPTHRGYRVPELLSAYRVHRRLWSWSLRPVDSAQYRPPEDSPYLYDERAASDRQAPHLFSAICATWIDCSRILKPAKCLLKSDSRSMNGVSELLCCNAKITSELASEKTPASCQVLLQSPSRERHYDARAGAFALGRHHATVSKLCQNPFVSGLWSFA